MPPHKGYNSPVPCDSGDEYRDPRDALYEDDPFDMRTARVSGKPYLTGPYSRKTLRSQFDERPRIDHLPEDISDPPLEEGVSFCQRMAHERDSEY